MFKKKDKKSLSNDQLREMGAVSFTMDDVREVQNQTESPNAEAYDYLVQAMEVSANYMGDTITDEGIRLDDVYPTTLDETTRMDQLLDQSERAVKDDNDAEYNKMIRELRGIVGWSRRRHFNFSWGIILGSIITVVAVMYWSKSDKETKANYEARLAQVKEWNPDNDSISLETAMKNANYNNQWQSATHYKAYKLSNAQFHHADYQKMAAEYRAKADTATTKDRKKYFIENADHYDKQIVKEAKRIEEVSAWDLKDAKKEAVKEAKDYLRSAAKAAAFSYGLMIFFILLIPVYIFANYSWGYVITRHREESRILGLIRKWGFAIAAGLFGAAAAMEYLPGVKVTTFYSNGSSSSHTEENGGNYIILAMKVMLMIAALAVIAVVSSGIMIYSTIVGLKRNYILQEKAA